MKIYVPKEEREIYDAFFKLYEPYLYQGTLENNKREAKKSRKQKMKCRFCKQTVPDTSFTQNTHILPHLLGNKGYYSDDECDKCNKIFGSFEDDLAKYLGLARTFNKITSGSSAPGFESGNADIGVKKYNNGIVAIEKKNYQVRTFLMIRTVVR